MTLKPYKLFFNCKKLAKVLGTKKLRIFHSFPTVYHLHHPTNGLKIQSNYLASFLDIFEFVIFKIIQKLCRI
jgi:hypothetical protein